MADLLRETAMLLRSCALAVSMLEYAVGTTFRRFTANAWNSTDVTNEVETDSSLSITFGSDDTRVSLQAHKIDTYFEINVTNVY